MFIENAIADRAKARACAGSPLARRTGRFRNWLRLGGPPSPCGLGRDIAAVARLICPRAEADGSSEPDRNRIDVVDLDQSRITDGGRDSGSWLVRPMRRLESAGQASTTV
jgi:hypothetical protein